MTTITFIAGVNKGLGFDILPRLKARDSSYYPEWSSS